MNQLEARRLEVRRRLGLEGEEPSPPHPVTDTQEEEHQETKKTIGTVDDEPSDSDTQAQSNKRAQEEETRLKEALNAISGQPTETVVKAQVDGRQDEPTKPDGDSGKTPSIAGVSPADDGSSVSTNGEPNTLREPEVLTPTTDVKEIKRRIDGTIANKKISQEFKRALIQAYEENNGLDVKALAKALGFGEGSLWRALQEHPAALERTRQNRAAATVDDLSQALRMMASKLRIALDNDAVEVTSKNIRDYAIAYGIFRDKLAVDLGEPNKRVEFGRTGDFEDRRRKMLEVLDRAESTLKMIPGGTPKKRTG